MTRKEIMDIQTRIRTPVDGFWGPKSIAAAQNYLLSLMPIPNPWPDTSQASLTAFYGIPGDESQHTLLDVRGMGVKYEGRAVKEIRCHRMVADSLGRVIAKLSKRFPEVLADYAGCYNNRPMRGGSTPSLHARAAAIDFMPDENGNKTAWPAVAKMPFEVMEIFAVEGWIAAGAFWGRDAMHFQATR